MLQHRAFNCVCTPPQINAANARQQHEKAGGLVRLTGHQKRWDQVSLVLRWVSGDVHDQLTIMHQLTIKHQLKNVHQLTIIHTNDLFLI